MSNINIENLSYDMNMDREAMDTLTGALGFSSFSIKRWVEKTYFNARRAYTPIGYTPIGRIVWTLRR